MNATRLLFTVPCLVLAMAVCSLPAAFALSRLPPDVLVTLRKIDSATGHELWRHTFARDWHPYRCELYEERVVVALHSIVPPASERERLHPLPPQYYTQLVFLDGARGQPATPFDTREFLFKEHDPQLAPTRNASRSILDERNELLLPNKWTSYGLGRLPWFSYEKPHKIHFFARADGALVWTLNLPAFAGAVSHWNSVVTYCRRDRTDSPRKFVDHLVGHRAGAPQPLWEFALPDDIPDQENNYMGERSYHRALIYAAGHTDIFAFGNGVLFALDPESGRAQRRWNLSTDSQTDERAIAFSRISVDDSGSSPIVFLSSHGIDAPRFLARVDLQPEPKITVLRTDLFHLVAPVVHDGIIYVFTETPAK